MTIVPAKAPLERLQSRVTTLHPGKRGPILATVDRKTKVKNRSVSRRAGVADRASVSKDDPFDHREA